MHLGAHGVAASPGRGTWQYALSRALLLALLSLSAVPLTWSAHAHGGVDESRVDIKVDTLRG